MRPIALTFCLASLLPSLLHAQDVMDIVRRAAELDTRNIEIARSYTYLQRQEERDLGSGGNLRKSESATYDVTQLDGLRYRRLVARNDQPLSPKEQQQQESKFQKSLAESRRETKEQHDRRVADWERKQQKEREPVKEMVNAFTFTLAGADTFNGVDTWVIDAAPKPEYHPKSQAAAFFRKVKLRFWIGKSDYQWVKLDMETLDTISFGGFLIRMAKGSHLTAENTRINNEVWMLKRAELKGSIRIALVKVLRGEVIFTCSDYKKFQTSSRIVGQ